MGDNRHGLARQITAAFCDGRLDLSLRHDAPRAGWDGVPEVAVANRLREAGKTDPEVRLLITFTAAMDRARDADRLWYASEKMFFDHPWVFQPREVAGRQLAELEGVLRSSGVSQRHSRDVTGWRTIGATLAGPASAPAVYRAIYEGKGDAAELLAARQARSADGSSLFPFIQGPKIGPMWVRMLAYPGGAEIASLEVLPVAVDVQVRKVTEYLGVTATHGQDLERVRQLIQDAWAEDVRRHGAVGPGPLADTAAALDPAIWFFGKWGCTRCEQAGRMVPISEICRGCKFEELHAAPSSALLL